MTSNHYVDNKKFLTEMAKHREAFLAAKERGEPAPQASRYICECIMKICENLSHKPRFLYYTYRDEMVLDGIEKCIKAVNNFDHTRFNNPFAYFTMIAYNAFWGRINLERDELYVKYKSTAMAGILDEYELNENEDGTFRQFELYQNISEYIDNYETHMSEKKNKKTKKPDAFGVEQFVGEE